MTILGRGKERSFTGGREKLSLVRGVLPGCGKRIHIGKETRLSRQGENGVTWRKRGDTTKTLERGSNWPHGGSRYEGPREGCRCYFSVPSGGVSVRPVGKVGMKLSGDALKKGGESLILFKKLKGLQLPHEIP